MTHLCKPNVLRQRLHCAKTNGILRPQPWYGIAEANAAKRQKPLGVTWTLRR